MSHRIHARLFIFARLFTACAALLLLTVTVMQRDDRDGYQATHLFFMPRENWEIDEGRGMLHEPEYYRDVDVEVLVEEELGNYYSYDQHSAANSPASRAAESELSALRVVSNANSHNPILTAARSIPNLSGNEIPVQQTGTNHLWGPDQSVIMLLTIVPLTIWVGDTPTPPPRREVSL